MYDVICYKEDKHRNDIVGGIYFVSCFDAGIALQIKELLNRDEELKKQYFARDKHGFWRPTNLKSYGKTIYECSLCSGLINPIHEPIERIFTCPRCKAIMTVEKEL